MVPDEESPVSGKKNRSCMRRMRIGNPFKKVSKSRVKRDLEKSLSMLVAGGIVLLVIITGFIVILSG